VAAGIRQFVAQEWKFLLTALIIPLLTYMWGEHQKEVAQIAAAGATQAARIEAKSHERVEQAQKNSQLLTSLLPYLADTDPTSGRQQLALVIVAHLRTEHAIPEALEAAFRQTVGDVNQRLAAGKAQPSDARALEAVAAAQDRPRVSGSNVVPAAVDVPLGRPRVYIQIARDTDLPRAQELQDKLRADGLLVPGIENVTATAKRKGTKPPRPYDVPTVVYFHDADAETARRVAQQWGANAVAKQVSIPAPTGQLECWFPGGAE
jgi:hypothetical protein